MLKNLLIFLLVLIVLNCNDYTKKSVKEIKTKSNFDSKKLTEFAISEISKFAKEHQNETFYGFSIDAHLLCLNSEEEFQKTLIKYRKRWGGYNTIDEINDLKQNPGDWKYQGFAEFDSINGFDMKAYLIHYHENDYYQKTSDYGLSMDTVVNNLIQSGVFDLLKKTDSFYANRVEHNY